MKLPLSIIRSDERKGTYQMDVKKIPHALECLLFIVLLFFCLLGATRLMVRKESINRFSPFLKNGKEYDVLFTGNSRVVNGIYPMELWEKYGIASYNIAANGNTLPVTYWTLMNALDYSQPRLVVVDIRWKLGGDVVEMIS